MKWKLASRGGILVTACRLALCLLAPHRLSADTLITFQVDMSTEVADRSFDPVADTVWVETLQWFQGGKTLAPFLKLTNNPVGSSACLYTGTGMDTNHAPGTMIGYRFVFEGDNWSDLGGVPYTALLPVTNGASLVLPVTYYNGVPPGGWPVTNTVELTFQVDMSQQASLGCFRLGQDQVGVIALFNTVDYSYPLTNRPAGTNTHIFTGGLSRTNFAPGDKLSYRFYYQSKAGLVSESPLSTLGNNRTAVLPTTTNATLVLPVVYFDDLPPGVPLVTNEVTFNVDMSAQFAGRKPDPWAEERLSVWCSGSFKGRSLALTNALPGNTNLYSGSLTLISLPGSRVEYNFGYSVSLMGLGGVGYDEKNLGPGGTKRFFNLLPTNGTVVLPSVYYGDLAPADVLTIPTVVQFRVDMAGAQSTDGHAFDPVLDRVFINGDFVRWRCDGCSGSAQPGWVDWNAFWWQPTLSLTNIPGTSIYATTLHPATSLVLTYRYSINGQDNEPPGGQNHVRYIRNAGEYSLPLDKFGAPEQEPSFGDLRAVLAGGNVRLSWLGRPGVRLQSRSNLDSAPWQDHPETDGLSTTNWPMAQGGTFFRLVKP